MTAEWQLAAYRVDLAKLTKLVGSQDKKLAARVVKAARQSGLAKDDRIEDSFDAIVDELIAGTLDDDHPRGYRIALTAFADVSALRVKFDVNEHSKNYAGLTTYADRTALGAILRKVGLPTLGKVWDTNNLSWPAKKPAKIAWPSASYWTAAQLASCAKELEASTKRGALPDRVRKATADEFFADDNADVIHVLAQIIGTCRSKLPAKRPSCVSGASDGLLVILDGDQ